MYRLFFSYRTKDEERVADLLTALRQLLPNLPFKDASEEVPRSTDWKQHAAKCLDTSDGVVCIVGPDTHTSEAIDWEIREAHRLGKPLMVTTLSEQYALPESCQELQIQAMPWKSDSVAGRVGELMLPKALLREHDANNESTSRRDLFDQYRLMVESWETLIGRRQTVNTLYVSADAALLAGIGALVSAAEHTGHIWSAAGVIVVAFLGLALSLNWRRTIDSYGILSTAKSKVVLALEDHLPAKLFDAEWKILEAKRYRSTTETDKQTALFFILLFGSVLAVACGVVGVELLSS